MIQSAMGFPRGVILAAASLGISALAAAGATRDPRAEKALRAAAEAGDARAQYEFGRLIARGGDRAGLAARWYRRAAEQGDADARRALSDYEAARGPGPRKGRVALDRARDCARTHPSEEECDMLFVAAAKEGSAEAQCRVGRARLAAVGAQEVDDLVRAPRTAESRGKPAVLEGVRYLRMAAEQGDMEAQYLLGGLLEEGTYLDRDPAQARLWYRRAADQGHQKAWMALEAPKDGARP
jgi:uncharacterized protein